MILIINIRSCDFSGERVAIVKHFVHDRFCIPKRREPAFPASSLIITKSDLDKRPDVIISHEDSQLYLVEREIQKQDAVKLELSRAASLAR